MKLETYKSKKGRDSKGYVLTAETIEDGQILEKMRNDIYGNSGLKPETSRTAHPGELNGNLCKKLFLSVEERI